MPTNQSTGLQGNADELKRKKGSEDLSQLQKGKG